MLKQSGFNENSRRVSIDVKKSDKQQTFTVEFADFSTAQTPMASVNLDGQTWIFECPPAIYDLVELYMTIPPSPAP